MNPHSLDSLSGRTSDRETRKRDGVLTAFSRRFSTIRASVPAFAGALFALALVGCGGSSDSENALEKGVNALRIFDFDEAYDYLSVAVGEMDPSDPQWVEAAYGLGVAAWHRSPSAAEFIEEAVELFQKVASVTDDDQVRFRCYLSLGRIEEIRDFVEEDKNVEGAPGSELASRAVFRLAQTYIDELNEESYETAVAMVSDYLTEYPDVRFANVGWQYVADIEKYYRKDNRAALAAMKKAYALGFAVESKEDIYIWQMANLALSVGDLEDGVVYLTEVVRSYPRSKFRWVSQQKLKELAEEYPQMNIEIPELTAFGEV